MQSSFESNVSIGCFLYFFHDPLWNEYTKMSLFNIIVVAAISISDAQIPWTKRLVCKT